MSRKSPELAVEERGSGCPRRSRAHVLRAQRGAVRSHTLEDLQERLAQPWSPDDVEETPADRENLSHAGREIRNIAAERREHRRGGSGRGGRRGRRARGGGGPGGRDA